MRPACGCCDSSAPPGLLLAAVMTVAGKQNVSVIVVYTAVCWPIPNGIGAGVGVFVLSDSLASVLASAPGVLACWSYPLALRWCWCWRVRWWHRRWGLVLACSSFLTCWRSYWWWPVRCAGWLALCGARVGLFVVFDLLSFVHAVARSSYWLVGVVLVVRALACSSFRPVGVRACGGLFLVVLGGIGIGIFVVLVGWRCAGGARVGVFVVSTRWRSCVWVVACSSLHGVGVGIFIILVGWHCAAVSVARWSFWLVGVRARGGPPVVILGGVGAGAGVRAFVVLVGVVLALAQSFVGIRVGVGPVGAVLDGVGIVRRSYSLVGVVLVSVRHRVHLLLVVVLFVCSPSHLRQPWWCCWPVCHHIRRRSWWCYSSIRDHIAGGGVFVRSRSRPSGAVRPFVVVLFHTPGTMTRGKGGLKGPLPPLHISCLLALAFVVVVRLARGWRPCRRWYNCKIES